MAGGLFQGRDSSRLLSLFRLQGPFDLCGDAQEREALRHLLEGRLMGFGAFHHFSDSLSDKSVIWSDLWKR